MQAIWWNKFRDSPVLVIYLLLWHCLKSIFHKNDAELLQVPLFCETCKNRVYKFDVVRLFLWYVNVYIRISNRCVKPFLRWKVNILYIGNPVLVWVALWRTSKVFFHHFHFFFHIESWKSLQKARRKYPRVNAHKHEGQSFAKCVMPVGSIFLSTFLCTLFLVQINQTKLSMMRSESLVSVWRSRIPSSRVVERETRCHPPLWSLNFNEHATRCEGSNNPG